MPIKVTVSPRTTVVTAVKSNKTAVSSIGLGARPDLTLGQLRNVDASDPDNGEVLVYDAAQNKYVVKPIVVDGNNIINITGGLF